MRLLDFLFEVIVAFILYVVAPDSFNGALYIAFLLLYSFQLYGLFRNQKTDRNWLSFNVLFFIMLTMVTYLVPFLYLIGLDNMIITIISYNDHYIFESLFMTSIAVSFYKLGFFSGEKKEGKNPTLLSKATINSVLKINTVLVIIATVVFWSSYTVSYFSGHKDISSLVVTLINCIFIFALIFSGYSNIIFKKSLVHFLFYHKVIYICAALIIVSMLILGDRYTPICLVVTILFVFNRFVHRFSFIQFSAIVVVGMVVLATISLTRNSDSSDWRSDLVYEENKTTYFQDLIPINLDFYLGLEWKEKNGLYKPGRIFHIMTYPIPFLPSYISNLFFDGEVSSGRVLTDYNRLISNRNDESGIGTHAIVDIYMSWGWVGVLLFFYLFGHIVGVTSKRSNNLYYLLIYGCLMSRAIYIPRETLFTPYRDIVYLLLLAFLLIPKQKKI